MGFEERYQQQFRVNISDTDGREKKIFMHLSILNLVVPLSLVEEKMFSILSWTGLERRNRSVFIEA